MFVVQRFIKTRRRLCGVNKEFSRYKIRQRAKFFRKTFKRIGKTYSYVKAAL